MLQRQFLNPYGFMQFNEATQEQMQMNMNPMMMNPVVMPPQMIRNSGIKEKLKLSDCDRLFSRIWSDAVSSSVNANDDASSTAKPSSAGSVQRPGER